VFHKERTTLIADVERYPEFVPLCHSLKIRQRTPRPDGTYPMRPPIWPGQRRGVSRSALQAVFSYLTTSRLSVGLLDG